MKLKMSRRGVALGVLFGVAATLSGIVLISYTQAFFLVVIFWIVAPLMLLQFIRWAKRAVRRG